MCGRLQLIGMKTFKKQLYIENVTYVPNDKRPITTIKRMRKTLHIVVICIVEVFSKTLSYNFDMQPKLNF